VKTLLLVDDDLDTLGSLHDLLRQDGYHVLLARTPAEGFEQLALHQVQVVICDTGLPATAAFFERVKDLHPHATRIVLTTDTDNEAILNAINRGAIHRYYTKPWNDDSLRANIREAFRHHLLAHRLGDAPLVPRAAGVPPTRRRIDLDKTREHISPR
jgi:response regulator RpfG family c-di-GMP phosphodiesterase